MLFGLSEIYEIEYFSLKSNKLERSQIKNLSVFAVGGSTPSDPFNKRFDKGICLKITFGEEHREQFDEICLVFNKNVIYDGVIYNGFAPFAIYLIGKDGIKIPTLCASGNGYQNYRGGEEETACFYTYVSPALFDNERRDET